MALPPKQQLFVDEYLGAARCNATEAARRAGYKHPNTQGPRLLVNVGVAQAIAAAQQQLSQRTNVTQDRIVKELARVAFIDPRKVFSWGPDGVTVQDSAELSEDDAACIAEASETITEKGGTIRIKLCDKLSALQMLGKTLGLFVDRHEHTFPDTAADAALDAELEALAGGRQAPGTGPAASAGPTGPPAG